MGDILITGAGGFIGRRLTDRLRSAGRQIRATSRKPERMREVPGIEWVKIDDIGPDTDWNAALRGIETVVHLAGRAHIAENSVNDSSAAFWRTNTYGSQRLAESAATAGVRRIVYVSSIKVNGERTGEKPFDETDEPRPENAYGQSKLEAERLLLSIGARTGMEIVIARPPLVYGYDASGNFGRLLRAVHRGIPLPFAKLDNRRSLINVENLVDLLMTCAEHPRAAAQIFVVSDDRDISTSELVRRLAAGMGKKARLVPVPETLLRLAGHAALGRDTTDRLCGSLQVSNAKARALLGWQPRIPLDAGLEAAAHQFMRHSSRRN